MREDIISPDDLVPLMAMLFWSHSVEELTEMFGKSRATLYRWREGTARVAIGMRPTMVKRLVQRSSNMMRGTRAEKYIAGIIRTELPKIDKRPLTRVSRQSDIQRVVTEYIAENPGLKAVNVVAFVQEACEAAWKRSIEATEIYRAVRNSDTLALIDGKFVLKATGSK